MICLVSLTSHPSEAEFDSFVSRPPRPSALSLIFQATAALGKLSPLGADTDTGYKLQHKPGRLGTMLQPLSSWLPSGRATNVQAEPHRTVYTTKLSSLVGGVICLVNSDNERDSVLLNSVRLSFGQTILLRGTGNS